MLANLNSNSAKPNATGTVNASNELDQEVTNHTVDKVRKDDEHFLASVRSKLAITMDNIWLISMPRQI